MKQPAITLKLWVVPHGYQVELKERVSMAPNVWQWSGCQDWSENHDVRAACVWLSMDIKNCIKTFEERHIKREVGKRRL